MKKFGKKLAALCLMLAILASAIPAVASAAGGLVVTSYEASSSSIVKGGKADITVHLKNTGLTADSAGSNLDVSRLVDSFTGGTMTVNVKSSGTAPLEFDVLCKGVTYSGSGKSFRLMAGVKGGEYESVDFTVAQAVEFDTTKTEPTPDIPATNPQPMVQVSRSDISAPVTAGTEFYLTVYFKNLGSTTIKTPLAAFSPSDGIILMDSVSSYVMEDINPGKTASVRLRLRAADTIASSSQTLATELKFNYFNGSSLTAGSVSDRVNIPAKVRTKDSASQPTVIVTRSAVKGPVRPGQEVPVTVSFRNAGKTALLNPVAVFSTTESLTLLGDYSTYVLKDIAPGQSQSVTVRVRANKDVSSTTQSVNVELKYSYEAGDGTSNGSVTDRVNLSTTPSSSGDSPTPNIIVTKFDYGGTPVSAGGKFPLSISFKNTSTGISIENIVATLETGESFAMDGAANTFYYNRIGAGAEQSQKIPMQALNTAKTGAQTATVSFKYEYVDGSKRASGTASVVLSIPVVQPDRFTILDPAVPEGVNANEETTITLSYVNKGKSEISNVAASIEAPKGSITTPANVQNLGNFESGKSGSIGFAFTPQSAGKLDLTLVVTYEDSNAQQQTKQFPLHLNVQEPAPIAEGEGAETQPQKSGNAWLWIILALTALGGGAATYFLRKRKKNKIPAEPVVSGWDDWDDDAVGDAAVNEETEADVRQQSGGDAEKTE